MNIRQLQRAIVDGLEDVKAQDIRIFNTEHLSPLFERVIVASGTSNRQTKALASSVREAVKKQGLQVLRTEGEENGEWIIVDCGAAVAHIMQPAVRDYYNLEEIWGGKPVSLKGPSRRASNAPTATEAKKVLKPAVKKAAKKAAKKSAKKSAKKAPKKTAPAVAAKAVAKRAAKRTSGNPAKPATTRAAKVTAKAGAKAATKVALPRTTRKT